MALLRHGIADPRGLIQVGNERMIRLLRAAACVALIGIPLAACTGRQPPATAAGAASMGQYVLQPGDRIEVRPVLEAAYGVVATLPPDGAIAVPSIGGRVLAAGKTVPELSALLATRFAAAQILVNPLVNVTLLDVAQTQVFVGGEVSRPGPVSVNGVTRSLLQVIVTRGGPLPTADLTDVAIIRAMPDGHLALLTFNLAAALNGTDLAQNTTVRTTDIVVVPKTRIAQLDVWVDQYIRRVSPVPLSFALRLSNTPAGSILP